MTSYIIPWEKKPLQTLRRLLFLLEEPIFLVRVDQLLKRVKIQGRKIGNDVMTSYLSQYDVILMPCACWELYSVFELYSPYLELRVTLKTCHIVHLLNYSMLLVCSQSYIVPQQSSK